MNAQQLISGWKQEPEFRARVGMILTHQGVVRGSSRDGRLVTALEVFPDHGKIAALRNAYALKPGIYRVAVEAFGGVRRPGDDLLFIVVAGDVRENVQAVLGELLERIKKEGVRKVEIYGDAHAG